MIQIWLRLGCDNTKFISIGIFTISAHFLYIYEHVAITKTASIEKDVVRYVSTDAFLAYYLYLLEKKHIGTYGSNRHVQFLVLPGKRLQTWIAVETRNGWDGHR